MYNTTCTFLCTEQAHVCTQYALVLYTLTWPFPPWATRSRGWCRGWLAWSCGTLVSAAAGRRGRRAWWRHSGPCWWPLSPGSFSCLSYPPGWEELSEGEMERDGEEESGEKAQKGEGTEERQEREDTESSFHRKWNKACMGSIASQHTHTHTHRGQSFCQHTHINNMKLPLFSLVGGVLWTLQGTRQSEQQHSWMSSSTPHTCTRPDSNNMTTQL